MFREIWRAARPHVARGRKWVRQHVPPGLRLVLGLLLIVGGVFGFLPVLGFWMIPLGLAVAALDVRLFWRKFRDWQRGR